MKFTPGMQKAFGNLDAITSKAFRRKTMGLKDPDAESEAVESGPDDETSEEIDTAGADNMKTDGSGDDSHEESNESLDPEALKRILEALSNGT